MEDAMANAAYTVRAHWDEESRSWWTDGEDIPGLTCQAATFDELVETVLALAPELLRENGAGTPDQSVDITVTAARRGHARLVA
jgi:predicted RNase H-like HicB family nuclease